MSKLEELIEELCPDGVEYRTISEIFNIRNGYTPSKSNSKFWENGTIPWFRMEDIRANGRILSDSIQHITKSSVKGTLFPANSIIMSTTATIGEHAIVLSPCITNQQITNFSTNDDYLAKLEIKYAFYCFFDFGKWCIENANKSGGVGIIGIQKLKQFQIPVPPLPVQREIVRILDNFTELTAELTARKKQYEYYRDKLLIFPSAELEV